MNVEFYQSGQINSILSFITVIRIPTDLPRLSAIPAESVGGD